MSRRNVAAKREVLPDPKYHDLMVTRLVNKIMNRGKKSIAEYLERAWREDPNLLRLVRWLGPQKAKRR